jgi:hypothetical protein
MKIDPEKCIHVVWSEHGGRMEIFLPDEELALLGAKLQHLALHKAEGRNVELDIPAMWHGEKKKFPGLTIKFR